MKYIFKFILFVLSITVRIFKWLFIEELFRIKEIKRLQIDYSDKETISTLYTAEVYRRIFRFPSRIKECGVVDEYMSHGIYNTDYCFSDRDTAERAIKNYKYHKKIENPEIIYHKVS